MSGGKKMLNIAQQRLLGICKAVVRAWRLGREVLECVG